MSEGWYFTLGCLHTCLGGWWESRGFGSRIRGWASSYGAKKALEAATHKQRRLASRQNTFISDHVQEEEATMAMTFFQAQETNLTGWCRISSQSTSG